MKGIFLYCNKNRIEIKKANTMMDLLLEIFNKGCVINNYHKVDFSKSINEAMESLLEKEKKVIKMKYGLDGNPSIDINEIANEMMISVDRVKIIEGRAYRKLRKNRYKNDFFRLKKEVNVNEPVTNEYIFLFKNILKYELSKLSFDYSSNDLFLGSILKRNKIDGSNLYYELKEYVNNDIGMASKNDEVLNSILYDNGHHSLLCENLSPKLLYFFLINGYIYLESVNNDAQKILETLTHQSYDNEIIEEFKNLVDKNEFCFIYPLNRKLVNFIQDNNLSTMEDLKRSLSLTNDIKILSNINDILGLSYYI